MHAKFALFVQAVQGDVPSWQYCRPVQTLMSTQDEKAGRCGSADSSVDASAPATCLQLASTADSLPSRRDAAADPAVRPPAALAAPAAAAAPPAAAPAAQAVRFKQNHMR